MNEIYIQGNLGSNPEIIPGQSGDFASFSIAVNSSYKNSQGDIVTNTEWIPCVCFKPGIVSHIQNHIKQGDTVFLKGTFSTRSYYVDHVINTKTNQPHKQFKTEIRVTHLHKVDVPKKSEDIEMEPAIVNAPTAAPTVASSSVEPATAPTIFHTSTAANLPEQAQLDIQDEQA